MRKWICLFAVGLVIHCAIAQSRAQDADATRHLWDTATSAPPSDAAPARKKPVKRLYRIATPAVPVTGVAPGTVIGVTLWRLRPIRPADRGERLITHEGPESTEWLPERVASGTRLAEGDRFRVSIEAARDGYLYVIDREEYADGSLGEPVLIFPTTRTRGGDNQVSAGRVVEIPGQDDAPPFFTLRKSRPDHVAESVTIIVSPAPLEGLNITDKQQRLSEKQVAAWQKQWGGQDGHLEMEDGAGRQWTRAEKDAGLDGTRSLGKADPVPQAIYYRPGVGSAEPVLVQVQLKYAQAGRRQKR